ncbi:MAG TPA: carboxymuconolactone decarboxylase family protein [Anaeromyxobacteraceae bacterium]|nr:carboxymuconolactone decarboxylase family protein [Anaeromyxobacteraceae bacterium]
MPPIPPEQMTEAQRAAAAALVAGPRGAVFGPFVPLLRSPELMDRLQKVGEYLRFRSALGQRLTELAILWVARRYTQQVEWAIHEPLARRSGVAPEAIAALAEGRRPVGLADDEAAACDLLEELWANGSVSDATYQRALVVLGERGIVDLLGLAGYYGLLSLVMNVARTPVPDGAPEPLERFPR